MRLDAAPAMLVSETKIKVLLECGKPTSKGKVCFKKAGFSVT